MAFSFSFPWARVSRPLLVGALAWHAATAPAKVHAIADTAAPLPIQQVRLMNYFPAAHAWTYMWTSWDPVTIQQDFARIAAMHFNTVRINLETGVFALPSPSAGALQQLATVIALADQQGLKVQLGLFDWFGNFADVADSKTWIDAVVTPYRNDPRIAFIDLRNELDTTVQAQLDWAAALLPYLKAAAGSIPVTVSVTAQSQLTVLQHLQALRAAGIQGDFVDVHLYGNAATACNQLQDIVAFANGAPVFVGETGYSTYAGYAVNNPGGALSGVPANAAATEAQQAYQLKTMSYAVQALGLPAIAPWAYADFTASAIPPSQVASSPPQYDFGLLRTDYSPKPAATLMTSVNSGVALSPDFNNGFEQIDDSGLPTLWRLRSKPCGSYPAPACGFQADFAADTSVSHSGGASARISNGISNQYGMPGFFLSPPTPTLPGHTYTATAFARGQNVAGAARVNLSLYTRAGCYLGSSTSASLPAGDSSWTPLSASIALPMQSNAQVCGGALPAYVEIHLESGAASPTGGGTVWFDDVTFGENVSPTAQRAPRLARAKRSH